MGLEQLSFDELTNYINENIRRSKFSKWATYSILQKLNSNWFSLDLTRDYIGATELRNNLYEDYFDIKKTEVLKKIPMRTIKGKINKFLMEDIKEECFRRELCVQADYRKYCSDVRKYNHELRPKKQSILVKIKLKNGIREIKLGRFVKYTPKAMKGVVDEFIKNKDILFESIPAVIPDAFYNRLAIKIWNKYHLKQSININYQQQMDLIIKNFLSKKKTSYYYNDIKRNYAILKKFIKNKKELEKKEKINN